MYHITWFDKAKGKQDSIKLHTIIAVKACVSTMQLQPTRYEGIIVTHKSMTSIRLVIQ